MKRIVVLFTLLVLMLPISPVHAQTRKQIPPTLEYYDAQIDVLLPHLADFQLSYHDAAGKYYQALQSHSQAPSVVTEPDQLSGKPTDQAEDLAYFWKDQAYLPAKLGWSFAINTYAGPDGDGYVLVVTGDIEGKIWSRSINVGPEEWRTSDWTETVPIN